MIIDMERLKSDAGYWDGCRDAIHEETGAPITKVRQIPRPTKPAAPEWDGEGYPPAGCECEYRPDPKIHDGWQVCIYLAHYDREHFVLVSETGEVDRMLDTLSPGFRFRPLRTKEQREREELKAIIADSERYGHDYITDAIISAGWHK